MGWLILWIIFGIVAACIARSKGRSFGKWFIYGFFLGVIALIHAIVIKEDNSTNYRQSFSGVSQKRCPKCSEFIRADASVCRFCGYSFVPGSSKPSPYEISLSNSAYSQPISEEEKENMWHCFNCGTDNYMELLNCKHCHAEKNSLMAMDPKNKKIIKEFCEKQIAQESIEEIKKVQDSFFNTSTLAFMKKFLPDANSFTVIDDYKKEVTSVLETVVKELSPDKNKKEDNSDKAPEEKKAVDDITIELQKIKNLYDQQLIDEDEYKAKKAQLLGL